jgi:hypothetical protein
MNLELQFGKSFCFAPLFRINGVEARITHFGEQFDRRPFGVSGCCGNMRFTRIKSAPESLDYYGITEAEYSEICDKLEKGLSFGTCNLCAQHEVEGERLFPNPMAEIVTA